MKHEAVVIKPEHAFKEAWLKKIKANGINAGQLNRWDRQLFEREFEKAFTALARLCRTGVTITSDDAWNEVLAATSNQGNKHGRAIRFGFRQMNKSPFAEVFMQHPVAASDDRYDFQMV